MSEKNCLLKRKTLKLSCPNPLFDKWLQEWRDEAAAKNSDTQHAFAKALKSLRKYPLPLKTGKECLILENFGTTICLLLDRKLIDYKKKHNIEEPDPLFNSNCAEEDCQPKVKKPRKKIDLSNTTCKENLYLNGGRGVLQRSRQPYVPALRSASYAVLTALYNHYKETGSPGEMSKAMLQKKAQPLSDTSMFKPLPGSYYSGWSCVGQLITKQLVRRLGNPHRFSLTEEGLTLAQKLPVVDTEIAEEIPRSSNSCDETGNQHEVINNKVKTNVKRTAGSSTVVPSTKHFQVCPTIEQDVKSLSDDFQSSQDEEEIFLPGTFQVILLVDTQEIHKGDELVKELEAEGVKLEVRSLKVGDFAWLSRNSAGQELLLPYIIERKRLDDLASSIKDGRFHEQKFRLTQSGIANCMYLVESHGQRQYSLPISTLLQAAANTQFIDRFTVKFTNNSHETVVYLSTFTKVLTRKFSDKTLLGCKKSLLPLFDIRDDCVSLMSFKEFKKLSSKTRKYSVKEMFIKQLVQLRGLSVEKALSIIERYPCPHSLMMAFKKEGCDQMLADISAGNLKRKIGPVISKAVFDLYNKPVLQ